MKRKLFALVPLLLSAAALFGCFAVGCGEEEEVKKPACKQHDWGEYQVIEPATCEKQGKHIRTCKVCGAEDPYTIIPALGHDWDEGTITTPAGCETKGVLTITCKNDPSHTKTQEIPATDHKWKVSKVIKPATCKEKGQQEMVCENDPSHTKTMDISPAGHTWGDWSWTVEGSCTKTGHREHTCTVCDVTEGEDVLPPGHTWGDWTDRVEPTCTEAGHCVHTCTVCETSETVPLAALGHDWGDWKIDKEVKCDEAGERSHTCKVEGCGATETEKIPASGHVWTFTEVTPATENAEGKETGTCANCTETIERTIPMLGAETGIYRIIVGKTNGRQIITWKQHEDGQLYRYYTDEKNQNVNYTTGIKITDKDGNFVFGGNLIAQEFYTKTENSGQKWTYSRELEPYLDVELPIDDYKVSLYDIPAGYIYQDSYELKKDSFVHVQPNEEGEGDVSGQDSRFSAETSAKDPVDRNGNKLENGNEKTLSASLTITLTSKKSEGRLPAKSAVSVDGKTGGLFKGAIIPDLTFTTVDDEIITLGKLLEEKEIVILDFYYYSCTWCQTAAPDFVKFANQFEDEIAVICLNGRDSKEDVAKKIYDPEDKYKYPDWFYCVMDVKDQFYYNAEKVNNDVGFPTQIIIDRGFCVADFIRSYQENGPEQIFHNLPGGFNLRNFEEEMGAGSSAGATFSALPEAVLPERKQLF